jgi:hypothetical protein
MLNYSLIIKIVLGLELSTSKVRSSARSVANKREIRITSREDIKDRVSRVFTILRPILDTRQGLFLSSISTI